MHLLTLQYRTELSALLGQRAAPVHLVKGFGDVRLMSEARVPGVRLGEHFVNENCSQTFFTSMRIEVGKIMLACDEAP